MRHRKPLEHDTFTFVRLRVAYRMIERDYRTNPQNYSGTHLSGLWALIEANRRDGIGILTPELQFYFRNVLAGYKLKELRDRGPCVAVRCISKRRPAPADRTPGAEPR